MTRESDVVRSLVEMADTLVDDYDVVESADWAHGLAASTSSASPPPG